MFFLEKGLTSTEVYLLIDTHRPLERFWTLDDLRLCQSFANYSLGPYRIPLRSLPPTDPAKGRTGVETFEKTSFNIRLTPVPGTDNIVYVGIGGSRVVWWAFTRLFTFCGKDICPLTSCSCIHDLGPTGPELK